MMAFQKNTTDGHIARISGQQGRRENENLMICARYNRRLQKLVQGPPGTYAALPRTLETQ